MGHSWDETAMSGYVRECWRDAEKAEERLYIDIAKGVQAMMVWATIVYMTERRVTISLLKQFVYASKLDQRSLG